MTQMNSIGNLYYLKDVPKKDEEDKWEEDIEKIEETQVQDV